MKEKTQLLAILDGDARDLYTKLATIWCGVSTENAEGPRLLWRLRRFRLALLAVEAWLFRGHTTCFNYQRN